MGMESLEIDASDIEHFFAAISLDGELSVDVETFVVGCMKLKGSARSMDLLSLCHSHRKLASRHKAFERRCFRELNAIRSAIDKTFEAIEAAADSPSVLAGDPCGHQFCL